MEKSACRLIKIGIAILLFCCLCILFCGDSTYHLPDPDRIMLGFPGIEYIGFNPYAGDVYHDGQIIVDYGHFYGVYLTMVWPDSGFYLAPCAFAVAVFDENNRLCWEKSLTIQPPYINSYYYSHLKCVDPSLLSKCPMTVDDMIEKYGHFCSWAGGAQIRPMYLLTDGRLVEFSIDTWSLEKGSLLEPRCIYYPPYYGYEWMIENSEAGHGRYDYGLPPKWR